MNDLKRRVIKSNTANLRKLSFKTIATINVLISYLPNHFMDIEQWQDNMYTAIYINEYTNNSKPQRYIAASVMIVLI